MNVLDTAILGAKTMLIMVANGTGTGTGSGSGSSVGTDVMTKITGAQDPNMGTISTSIENTGNGLIYIGMTLVAVIGVLALLLAAGKIMLGGAVQKSEGKNSLFWVILAAVVAFGAIGIIALAATMSGTFFN